MDNDDEKIRVCFIGYGMSKDVQLAFVRVAKELRDVGFTLVEAVKGLREVFLVGDEPMVRRDELQNILFCRREVDRPILIRDYGPETHIRSSGSGPVSRIRPSDFRSHIRPLRMLDSRSGMKGKTIRKRLGK